MEPQKFLPQFSLGLTFNDVLLLPGYSDFTRRDINLSAYLTRTIKLEIPFVSAPMDTVTESKLSIALGKLGGIGIIHRNLTVSDQVRIVKKVKSKKVLVGAATGSSPGFEERTKALVLSGVDLILIDSAHGFTKSIIDAVKFIKKTYPKMQVIAGNVATYEGTKALIHAGVDGLRVGMGDYPVAAAAPVPAAAGHRQRPPALPCRLAAVPRPCRRTGAVVEHKIIQDRLHHIVAHARQPDAAAQSGICRRNRVMGRHGTQIAAQLVVPVGASPGIRSSVLYR